MAHPYEFTGRYASEVRELVSDHFQSGSKPCKGRGVGVILLVRFVGGLAKVVGIYQVRDRTIPVEFISPVFPVLRGIVRQGSPFAMFFGSYLRFVRQLVAFFKLPRTVRPFSGRQRIPHRFPVANGSFIRVLTVSGVVIKDVACFKDG